MAQPTYHEVLQENRLLRQAFFGIALSRGGSCQIMLRAAGRLEENYHAISKRVQASPWIVPDETGWRIAGRSARGGKGVIHLYATFRGRRVKSSAETGT